MAGGPLRWLVPPSKDRTTIKVAAERAVLAAVRLPDSIYDPSDPFGELTALAEQAGAMVVGELSQSLPAPIAGTYMGKGKVEELRGLCERLDASTIIFDHDLSPRHIASIEKATDRKVLDRSELILDIFAGRATTHEAKLQVELAQLEYTYPRLRAMWSHLERIVGAGGSSSLTGGVGTRGPGEQQIEIDRRLVQQRKSELLRELREIQARRRREVRARNAEHFTVGLVGYTNAGKSTLFNTLTAGGAYADDRLFATLMTRTRRWELGRGASVMLSDTVGFVRDLPHNLVASFKATLEEATHADLLLIVLDVSDPAAELHYDTVRDTLDDLFAEVAEVERKAAAEAERAGVKHQPWQRPPSVLLLNKADLLADPRELLIWTARAPGSIAVCALPGADGRLRIGHDDLVSRVRRAVLGERRRLVVDVPLADGKTVHEIESRGRVLDRAYEGDRVRLTVEIGVKDVARLRASGADIQIEGQGVPPPPERPPWRDEE